MDEKTQIATAIHQIEHDSRCAKRQANVCWHAKKGSEEGHCSRKMSEKLSWEKDELTQRSSKVGEACFDILSKPQEMQEVGETLDAMTPRYWQELYETIYANKDKLSAPFYIVVLRKKEPWALNILRQWFIARQTKPTAKFLRECYPNHDHDLWRINFPSSQVALEWTLPTAQDSDTILKNRWLYHEDLVKWIVQYNAGRLE